VKGPHPNPLPEGEGVILTGPEVLSPFGRGTRGIRVTIPTGFRLLRQPPRSAPYRRHAATSGFATTSTKGRTAPHGPNSLASSAVLYYNPRADDFGSCFGKGSEGRFIMRQFAGIVVRSLIIACVAASIGLGLNLASNKALPWIYVPPKELVLEGVRVKLIDEKEARRLFDIPETLFVDSRHQDDYRKGHVKGAIFLEPAEKEERFPVVQALLPENGLLILYCYGPECDMAEQVAGFLAQLGYKNMMIMTAGFRLWEKAGYPVEGKGDRG